LYSNRNENGITSAAWLQSYVVVFRTFCLLRRRNIVKRKGVRGITNRISKKLIKYH
jgi:hypothetical protein